MTNFHIYKASAGSGKTYTLVKEYIEKCLANNYKISHQSLLAITFTNKAASEMKSRIINTLFEFTHGFDEIPDTSSRQLYNDLKLKLNYTDLELIEKSKKVLSDIIHYYSLFSVSTIDKFIHKIIRGFSYELDLSSNFEVEMEHDKIIQDGVWTILDEIGTDKSITDNLLKYSLYKTQQNKNWDIEEDLLKISTHLFKEHKSGFINKLPDAKTIKKEQSVLISRIKHFESQLNSIRIDVEKIISGIPEIVFLYKDLPNYLYKIRMSPYLNIGLSTRFKESILNKKWYKKSASTNHKEQVDNISDLLQDKLMYLLNLINTEYPNYLFYKQCYNSFFSVAVLKNIDEKIESIKQENNIVHISEFNQIILKFLNQNPIPFIYEKIGTRYNHYFIDEFQDTSIIQWNNLIPLVQEALSIGGSCLIVGDGKQSIYRWRGGDVGQFLLLCNSEETHPMSQFSAQIKSLNINYRSSKNIVDFNNKFFSFLSKNLLAPYDNLYNTLNQKSSSKMGGYVEVSGLSLKGEEVVEKTLELIYNRIISSLNDGYQFSDICILTRSNKEITKLASYLTDQDIPIISSESLLLKKSPVVHFLINNLSIIFDETDFLSKAKVLEYMINNQIIDTASVSKHSLLSDYAKVDNLKFESFLKMSGVVWPVKTYRRLNLYEIIEDLIRVFSLNTSPSIYINFFLDFVYDFSIKRNNSIKDFLNFWDQKKGIASIVIPNGINAVELMTIHKSKGLQFPVVIFPFANWKEDLGTDNSWFNVNSVIFQTPPEKELLTLLPLKKELENWPNPFPAIYKKHKNAVRLDSINLLYVAMTRPKDRLYIITNSDPKKGMIYKYFEDVFKDNNSNIIEQNMFNYGECSKNNFKEKIVDHIDNSILISESWRSRLVIQKKRSFNKKLKQKFSIAWGELVHDIMAGINTKSDVDIVLDKHKIIEKHGIDVFKRIKSEIETIVYDKRIAHLFEDGLDVFSEISIVDPLGNIHRPDRVVVHSKDSATLIDYKTGEQSNSHYKQIKKYENILLEIGYKKIQKYLIYLSTSEIKEVK